MRWYVWIAHLAVFIILSLIVEALATWAWTNQLPRASYSLEWVTVAIGVYGIFVGLVFWCAVIVRVGRLIERLGVFARRTRP